MPSPSQGYTYDDSVKSNLSDELVNVYLQRPLAGLIAKAVYAYPITPNQLTIAAVLFGVVGAIFLAVSQPDFAAAAVCFYLKDLLDSADGQLARAKQLYSRRGRFLDSIGDYFVSALLFSGSFAVLMHEGDGLGFSFFVLFFGFWGTTLRVSYHVFYQTSYLHTRSTYETNRVTEEIQPEDFYQDKTTLRLQKTFLFLYGWQDRLMVRLDEWSRGETGAASSDKLNAWYADAIGLRLGGFLGFGTEFVFLTICLFLHRLDLYLFFTLVVLNCIWGIAFFYRKVILRRKIFKVEQKAG
ncbi:MAG TPA: CDP-alcohol phosphatidyltransferase family protein [Bacteroidota bacterium]|nr:CDP-alcohol phosphatidyltransferase family protein [Bacteroidota bacterium]